MKISSYFSANNKNGLTKALIGFLQHTDDWMNSEEANFLYHDLISSLSQACGDLIAVTPTLEEINQLNEKLSWALFHYGEVTLTYGAEMKNQIYQSTLDCFKEVINKKEHTEKRIIQLELGLFAFIFLMLLVCGIFYICYKCECYSSLSDMCGSFGRFLAAPCRAQRGRKKEEEKLLKNDEEAQAFVNH